jgi:hypothetical protein
VFAIQAGVCIVVAAAAGRARDRHGQACVRYADVWRNGAFTERNKLTLLDSAQNGQVTLSFVDIDTVNLSDFVPYAFAGLDGLAYRIVSRIEDTG